MFRYLILVIWIISFVQADENITAEMKNSDTEITIVDNGDTLMFYGHYLGLTEIIKVEDDKVIYSTGCCTMSCTGEIFPKEKRSIITSCSVYLTA